MNKIKIVNGEIFNSQTNEKLERKEAICLLANVEIGLNSKGVVSTYKLNGKRVKKEDIEEPMKKAEQELDALFGSNTINADTIEMKMIDLYAEIEELKKENRKLKTKMVEYDENNSIITEILSQAKEALGTLQEDGVNNSNEIKNLIELVDTHNETFQKLYSDIEEMGNHIKKKIESIENSSGGAVDNKELMVDMKQIREDVVVLTKVIGKVRELATESTEKICQTNKNFEEKVIEAIEKNSERIGITQDEHFDEAIKVVIKEAIQGDMLKNNEISNGRKAVAQNNKSNNGNSMLKWLGVGGAVIGAIFLIAKMKGFL